MKQGLFLICLYVANIAAWLYILRVVLYQARELRILKNKSTSGKFDAEHEEGVIYDGLE